MESFGWDFHLTIGAGIDYTAVYLHTLLNDNTGDSYLRGRQKYEALSCSLVQIHKNGVLSIQIIFFITLYREIHSQSLKQSLRTMKQLSSIIVHLTIV